MNMKELSIEEKAKRFDEALSVAQETYTTQPMYREWLTKMFPELKESDDERIKKALIRFHKSTIDIDGIKGADVITWLEKQGDQKPTWSEGDESIALGIEQLCNCADLLMIAPDKIDKIRNWLKSLKDRYTWKPSDEQMDALRQIISGCSYDIEPLVEMEEQLKKLREE